MKLNLRIVTTLAALMSCTMLFAQQWEEGAGIPPTRGNAQEIDEGNDVQGRFSAGLQIPLGQKWSLTWSEQVRTMDNFGKLDKIVSTIGVGYKPWEFLKFDIDYSLVNECQYDTEEMEVQIPVLNDDGSQKIDNMTGEPIYNFAMQDVETKNWGLRHRTNIDVTGMYRIGRLKLSLRERLRVQYRTDSVCKYEKPATTFSLRSRFKTAYDIRNSRWEPYAFVELYTMLNSPKPVDNFKEFPLQHEAYINRIRLAVGTEFKIHNHHRMDIYYMVHFNRTYNARYKGNKGDLKEWSLEKMCNHVIGIDYKFKL